MKPMLAHHQYGTSYKLYKITESFDCAHYARIPLFWENIAHRPKPLCVETAARKSLLRGEEGPS